MFGQVTKRIFVIDTDVLVTAAGEKSLDPRSVECMDFLQHILSVCHSIIVSEDLEKEWDCHRTRATERWRAEMEDSKKVLRLKVCRDSSLRDTIARRSGSYGVIATLDKDAHLVEACRKADMMIASNDDRARNSFAQCASDVAWLGDVVWVNPATDSDLVEWLKLGAPSAPLKRLSAVRLPRT